MNALIIIGTIILALSALGGVLGGYLIHLGNKQDSEKAQKEVLSTVNKEGDSTRETVESEGKHSRENSDKNAQKVMKELQEMNKKFSPLLSKNDPSKYDDTYNFTFDNAFNLSQQNKHSDASVLWDILIQNFAADYIVLNNKGAALAKLGEYEDAVNWFSKSIDIEPSSKAFRNRAEIYYRFEKFIEAIQDCNAAIKLNPDFVEAYQIRLFAYSALGEFDKALQDCNIAIELDPKNAGQYTNRAMVFERKGQYDKAFKDYEKAIKLDPNFVHSYVNRGVLYLNTGEYSKALNDYNKAIELGANNVVFANRARVKYELDDKSGACEDINKAVEMGAQVPSEIIAKYCARGCP